GSGSTTVSASANPQDLKRDPGTVAGVASKALPSVVTIDAQGGAVEAAHGLPAQQGQALVSAAQESFVEGLGFAAGVGATVLLATAVAAWFLLRGQKLEDGIVHQ
ncbi:hypothetical protein R6M67_41490, partial [Streptomyces sp. Wh19]|nr:hypothetical protein [Streptomyces sp. Wh19]